MQTKDVRPWETTRPTIITRVMSTENHSPIASFELQSTPRITHWHIAFSVHLIRLRAIVLPSKTHTPSLVHTFRPIPRGMHYEGVNCQCRAGMSVNHLPHTAQVKGGSYCQIKGLVVSYGSSHLLNICIELASLGLPRRRQRPIRPSRI